MNFINMLADPKNSKSLKRVCYVVLAMLVVADFFVPRHHVSFPWDEIPGFSAFYGFIACVLIIAISKGLGYIWLMKKEDYYD